MDKVWGEIDRRGYTRVSVKNTELWIKKKKDKDFQFSEIGFLKDIGIGGLSFYSSPEEFTQKEKIVMRFQLPKFGLLEISGIVLHIQKITQQGQELWVYGVEFSGLSNDYRRAIKDFVLEQLSLDRFFSEAKRTAT